MKFKMLVFVSVLYFSLFSVNLQAQIIGKIFSKSEANTLFGAVIESKDISVSELKTLVGLTNKYVMFSIKNGAVAIKGDDEKLIYNSGIALSERDVFKKYSKSMVLDLLFLSTSGIIAVENRGKVITLTTGEVTLELSLDCPPYCN